MNAINSRAHKRKKRDSFLSEPSFCNITHLTSCTNKTKKAMRFLYSFGAIAVLFLLGSIMAPACEAKKTRVTAERISFLLHELGRARIVANNPGGGSSPVRSDAMFVLALFESVNAVEQKYEPFMVPFLSIPSSINLRKADKLVACAQAGRRILDSLYPAPFPAEQFLHHELSKILIESSGVSNEDRAHGEALGEFVASVILANRSNDGWTIVPRHISVINGTKAGEFIYGTPYYPGSLPFASGYGTYVLPFARDSCADPVFDMVPPPVFGSPASIADMEGVFPYGTSDPARNLNTSTTYEIATFHDGYFAAGTHIAYNFITSAQHTLDDVDLLRVLALAAVATNDAHACHWYRKYLILRGRPLTDFRTLDVAEYPQLAHLRDDQWTSPRGTNLHPEYPSGHSSRTSAFMSSLRSLMGDLAFRAQGYSTPQLSRSFNSVTAFIEDVNMARLYGGMHYRTGVDEGTRYGKQVSDAYIAEFMRPLND